MNNKVSLEDCTAEVARFFKKYHVFCSSPDPDAVRDVLFSAYSVNDKLRKAGYTDFFKDDNFLAIKAARNYAAHQAELHNNSKAISLEMMTKLKADTAIMCLLPVNVVDAIADSVDNKGKRAIKNTFIFYTKYVDIYPCIFNIGVLLYFQVVNLNLQISSPEFLEMKKSIEYEILNNYPHYINGKVTLLKGGCIDDFIDNSLISISERASEIKELPKDDNGMFTYIPPQ